MNALDLTNAARELYAAGLNVLPALRAEKRPAIAWKKFVATRPAFDEVFKSGTKFDALCVVCGPTSGGLEILDFDQKGAAFEEWKKSLAEELPLSGLAELVAESTQSGGRHVAFRSDFCAKNQKLARDEKGGVLIETRGLGGICLIAPTDGYEVLAGSWTNVPKISEEVRATLFDVATTFDILHAPSYVQTPPASYGSARASAPAPVSSFQTVPVASFASSSESVADYLRRTGEGRNALARAGWTYLRDDGEFEQWSRPNQPVAGKAGGSWSKKDGFFHCFSSNAAPLEPNATYSPLQLIALLDFNGNVSEASKYWTGRSRNFFGTSSAPIVVATAEEETEVRDEPPPKPKPFERVPFPESLLECDGLIGDLAAIANRYAIRLQPEGAFLAAFAATSFVAGRTLALNYNGSLVTPNLYALFLAPSGMGKEVPRRVLSSIASIYAPNESVPESFASVQALQNLTARVKKVLWLHDEFGRDLQVMTGRHANANVSGVITESLKLFSNANNRNYLPKLVAAEAKGTRRPDGVDRPSLTIFATGNPREFFQGTNESVLNNGYVSRFTIVYGRDYSPKRQPTFEEATNAEPLAIPAAIASRIRAWKDLETAAAPAPFLASFERSAFDAITQHDEEFEHKMRDAAAEGLGLAEFRARLFEKIWKYALIFAASRYGARSDLAVDLDSAERAIALVDYEERNFETNAERFANSETSALAEDMLEWFAALGRPASRSEWVRKFQRRDKRQREEALEYLGEAGYLIALTEDGKQCYALKQ